MDWVSEEVKTRITPLLNAYGIRLVAFEDFLNTQQENTRTKIEKPSPNHIKHVKHRKPI
jgi:hypothetical protein